MKTLAEKVIKYSVQKLSTKELAYWLCLKGWDLPLTVLKGFAKPGPKDPFWSGEGQHCLLKVLCFCIDIRSTVALEAVLRESRLKAQSPGLTYYKFSWEGLLWDRQPFEFFFFSWNTHPLVSFAFHSTCVASFVLVLHIMQVSQSLLPNVIKNVSSPSDREDDSHAPSPALKTNQETKKTPPTCVVRNLVFKTSWTAPTSDALMENYDNLLLLESAINVLPGTYLWVTTVAGKTMKPVDESSGLKRRHLPHQTHNSVHVYKHLYKRPHILALPEGSKRMLF